MPKATVYQESTNRRQKQDQDDETKPQTDAIKVLFVNQDLQMLTDNGYKDHKQFVGFVGIEMACCNCKQLFLSSNKLYKHLKEECSQKAKAILKKAYHIIRLAIRALAAAAAPLCALTPDNAPIMS